MESVTYPFGSDFQLKILALLVRDKRFLQAHRQVIKPQYFDNPIFLSLCKKVLNYYDRYRAVPSMVVLSDLVGTDRAADDLEMLIDRLFEVDLDDAEYIKSKTLHFARNQAVIRAQFKIEELRKVGDFEGIKTAVDKAVLVGTEHEDMGHDFFRDTDVLCEFLSDDGRRELRLPTLIAELDDVIGGGISTGELNVMMAPPNEGKSIWLTNMTYSGMFQKKNVLFVSVEMNDLKISKRLASRMTGIPINELQDHIDDLPGLLEEHSKVCGKLKVKRYPSASVEDIRTLIINLQQTEGFVTEVLVVDYLDILRPKNRGADAYQAQGEIAKDLRALAAEFNLYLWTATQANRNSVGKDRLGMNDKADSWLVMADSDIVLGLTRSEMDAQHDTATIALAKIRDGDKSSRTISVRADYNLMFFGDL